MAILKSILEIEEKIEKDKLKAQDKAQVIIEDERIKTEMEIEKMYNDVSVTEANNVLKTEQIIADKTVEIINKYDVLSNEIATKAQKKLEKVEDFLYKKVFEI